MKKIRIAIIGGTGADNTLNGDTKLRIGTPYGPSSMITIVKIGSNDVVFLPRHGEKHSIPPHKINYLANIWALHKLNVERIIATNAVGAINLQYEPGDYAILSDFIDFTKSRALSFYDDAPVTHIDVSQLYCLELRGFLKKAALKSGKIVRDEAVYLCTEGPRYETPAEIRMFRSFGCDVIGMTGLPEAILAHELGICYAALCFVSNMAAGIENHISAEEVIERVRIFKVSTNKILKECIDTIPRKRNCLCSSALEGARI